MFRHIAATAVAVMLLPAVAVAGEKTIVLSVGNAN